MANIIDAGKRAHEARNGLRLLGYTDQQIEIMEQAAVKMVDNMVAANWPPMFGILSMYMVEAMVAARANMSKSDIEEIRATALSACKDIADEFIGSLDVIRVTGSQEEARRITDFSDAWNTKGKYSEMDVT